MSLSRVKKGVQKLSLVTAFVALQPISSMWPNAWFCLSLKDVCEMLRVPWPTTSQTKIRQLIDGFPSCRVAWWSGRRAVNRPPLREVFPLKEIAVIEAGDRQLLLAWVQPKVKRTTGIALCKEPKAPADGTKRFPQQQQPLQCWCGPASRKSQCSPSS